MDKFPELAYLSPTTNTRTEFAFNRSSEQTTDQIQELLSANLELNRKLQLAEKTINEFKSRIGVPVSIDIPKSRTEAKNQIASDSHQALANFVASATDNQEVAALRSANTQATVQNDVQPTAPDNPQPTSQNNTQTNAPENTQTTQPNGTQLVLQTRAQRGVSDDSASDDHGSDNHGSDVNDIAQLSEIKPKISEPVASNTRSSQSAGNTNATQKSQPQPQAKDQFVIQLAAFRDRKRAETLITQLYEKRPRLFSSTMLRVQSHRLPSGSQLFRVLSIAISRDEATSICEVLWTERIGCLIKTAS